MNGPVRNPEKTPSSAWRRKLALYAERVLALAIALLLLRSSFAHLGNPYLFLASVYSYDILPIELGKWLAIVLPYLQLVVAVSLLTSWWLREAYLLALGMFVTFVIAQVIVMWNGLEIPCGCFGFSRSLQVGWSTLSVAAAAGAASSFGLVLVVLRQGKPATQLPEDART
jgi:hypothetical protein